jgi:predicted acylesterase/phospholipase RssA
MSPQPLKTLALSLSGGGFRASAFHLGVLSFLHDVQFKFHDEEVETNLLDRIEVLSTISGGTITGMMYAQGEALGTPFRDSFLKLYSLLSEDKLVDTALEKLDGKKAWADPGKTRNLINAFADVYQESYFDGDTFSIFQGINKVFIFNATEFQDGLAFRFQNSGVFGNNGFRIPEDAGSCTRLGDIVAASSCFPMGFEPLVFPKDFCADEDSPLFQYWKEKGHKPLALMDGGIIDNQGIDGVNLAADRLKKEDIHIESYIISSVESKKVEGYEPKPEKKPNWFKKLKLQTFKSLLISLGILALVNSAILYWLYPEGIGIFKNTIVFIQALLGIYFLGFWGLIKILQNKLEDTVQKMVDTEDQSLKTSLKALDKAQLGVLWNLIGVRTFSFLSMVNGVFLRRIRRLQFEGVFNGRWKNKAYGNFIYHLKEKLPPGAHPKWKTYIRNANAMPTTLWFKKDHESDEMLKSLVLCGQLTICCSTLDYLEDLQGRSVWEEISEATKEDLQKLSSILLENREKLLKNPDFLLNKYLKS